MFRMFFTGHGVIDGHMPCSSLESF